MAPAELIGRDAEAEIVDSLVGHVGDAGGSLLIRGEPGIGKSALLVLAMLLRQFAGIAAMVAGHARLARQARSRVRPAAGRER